jgi:hypothetical protein
METGRRETGREVFGLPSEALAKEGAWCLVLVHKFANVFSQSSFVLFVDLLSSCFFRVRGRESVVCGR